MLSPILCRLLSGSLLTVGLLLGLTACNYDDPQQGQVISLAVQHRFSQFDRNNDGQITVDELNRPALFNRVDRDRNGSISLQEASDYIERKWSARRTTHVAANPPVVIAGVNEQHWHTLSDWSSYPRFDAAFPMPGYSPLSDRGNPGLRTGRAYDARKSAPMPYLARNAQSDPAPDDRSTDSEMADPDRGIANTPNRAATGAGSDYTLIHNGLTRHYSLYAPLAHRPGTPTPLLIMLHGGGQRLDRFMQTGMDRVAAANGFIVAYPSGATPDGVKPSWNAGSASPTGYAEQVHVDDVGFIRSMIEQISKKYDIDAKRIYVAGVSKGGMMAYRLACEMSDRIAAIATVAATMTTPQCRPARPVPVLHIHGTEDNNVPLDGGRGEYSARMAHYPSVYDTLKDWRRFNHCSPEHRNYSEGPEARCEAYEQCRDGASVTLCLIEGGGHVWPGVPATARQERRGQYSSNRFPTNEVIWRFFAQHRRP